MAETDAVIGVLQRALDCGRVIEIDGYGRFQKREDGGYEFVPEARPNVFIAYAMEDLANARRLGDASARSGFHAVAGQGPTNGGSKLAAGNRARDRPFGRFHCVPLAALRHQTGHISGGTALCAGLRDTNASGRCVLCTGTI